MTEPLWLTEARKCIGIKEASGALNNPKVVQFYKEAGFPSVTHDDVAWCAAFLGAMLYRAGHKGSGSLGARSYEKWGQELKRPFLGAIGVKHRSGKPAGWLGHVGIVVAANTTTIWMVSGNANDSVNIAPYKRKEFTAFRWVEGVPICHDPLPTRLSAKGEVSEA